MPFELPQRTHVTWYVVAGLMLGACATPSPAPAPPPVPASAPAEPPAATAPAPPPAQEPVAPPPPVVVTPASQQQAQKIALTAVEFLEQGNEDAARRELERALARDPNNKLATSLLRQMTADPLATLGQESFSYVVKPGETLSRIAERFLKDVYSFYILARYNNIRVPRQLQGGQSLRIPGRAPPPGALEARPAPRVVVPPAPPPSAPEPAPAPVETARTQPAAEADPAAALKAEAQRKQQLIALHTRNARAAMAKQDLDGAIRSWDEVLKIDAGNSTATLERQRVVGLQEKLGKVK